MEVSYKKAVGASPELARALRMEIVEYARKQGIKPAARDYKVSRKTVQKWKRRYEAGEGVDNRSTKPHRSPAAMKSYWRYKIINAARADITRLEKNRASASKPIVIQATWLKREFKIPYSIPAILRVLHREGLKKVRPQKPKRTPSDVIRQRKARLNPFDLVQVDIKHLNDIHGYAPLIDRFNLPKYQITARDVRTGALFVGLSAQKTVTHTAVFIDALCAHLSHHGVSLGDVTVQTDNGREFTNRFSDGHATAFSTLTMLKWGCQHRLIPLGQCNWQSDVESSHRLIEDELWLHMLPPAGYHAYIHEVQRYVTAFNTTRYNSYKGGSPLILLQQSGTTIDEGVLHWQVIDCDRLMTSERLREHAGWYRTAQENHFHEQTRLHMRVPYMLPKLPEALKGVA